MLYYHYYYNTSVTELDAARRFLFSKTQRPYHTCTQYIVMVDIIKYVFVPHEIPDVAETHPNNKYTIQIEFFSDQMLNNLYDNHLPRVPISLPLISVQLLQYTLLIYMRLYTPVCSYSPYCFALVQLHYNPCIYIYIMHIVHTYYIYIIKCI